MIRPLRIRHRRTVVVLSVLIPLLFVAGLLARRPIPRMKSVPGSSPAVPRATNVISRSDEAWPGLPIRTTWLRDDATARRMIRLEILDELERPDLLVYWSATGKGAVLPDDAILLGGIADGGQGAWPLPEAAETGGSLLLYSLADAEVVGSSEIAGADGAPSGAVR